MFAPHYVLCTIQQFLWLFPRMIVIDMSIFIAHTIPRYYIIYFNECPMLLQKNSIHSYFFNISFYWKIQSFFC